MIQKIFKENKEPVEGLEPSNSRSAGGLLSHSDTLAFIAVELLKKCALYQINFILIFF